MISAVKKCQICGKPAHVFLTQVVNSEITELSLCEKCAKERGFFDPESLTLAEENFPEVVKKKVDELAREIAERLKNNENLMSALPSSKRDLRSKSLRECPECSFTLETIAATGRVGCPECYMYFRHDLSKIAHVLNYEDHAVDEVSHSDSTDIHAPRASKPHPMGVSEVQRRKILQTQMKKAIIREDYERAALLRDELKKLESES